MGMVPLWVHIFPTWPDIWDECMECRGCLLLSEEWMEKRYKAEDWELNELEKELKHHIDEEHRDDIDDLIDRALKIFKALKESPEETE